jgi:late competence protein required for DNA uptake (superfamily II DNA/RNA helicase)
MDGIEKKKSNSIQLKDRGSPCNFAMPNTFWDGGERKNQKRKKLSPKLCRVMETDTRHPIM